MAHFPGLQAPEEFKHMRVGERRDLTPHVQGIAEEGVVKEILEEGHGEYYGNVNDKITLEYVAYKGTEPAEEYMFDSSEKDGKPFTFEVLKSQVVRGFEMAIMTMKVGERARITLAPMYAFGKSGAPPKVPADCHVTFDTKIHSIEPEDVSPEVDRTITKHVLKRGVGWTQPNEGCMMKLNITGKFGNKVFLEGEKEFLKGEGSDPRIGIPQFVEEYLTEWRPSEIAVLKMKADHCYGSEGCPKYDIPPNTDLEFEIHMINFERVKDVWEMDEQERMDQCDMFKQKGNEYYKRNEYALSRKFYDKVVDSLEFDLLMTGDDEVRRKELLSKARTNLANVYIKEENYLEARRCCDKVLEENPNNVKALHHRAKAYYCTQDYEEALKDFKELLKCEPGNKVAKNHVILCQQKLKDKKSQEKVLYQRMCTPMDTSDSERYSSAMEDITHWDNSMAQGMMTLEQEAEAWGDALPPKGDNNHGNH